jgi:hypothetical protein
LAFFWLVNVLGDLQTVLRNILIANVRFVPHPSNATPTKEPILNAMLHGCAEVWVMLNLKVQRAFDQLRGTLPTGSLSPNRRETSPLAIGVNSRDQASGRLTRGY